MEFPDLVDHVLAGFYRHNPVFATSIGMHEYDDRWPDLGESGREAWLAFLSDARAELGAVDLAALPEEQRVDHRILLANVDAGIFRADVLREESWNPLSYVYLFGSGLFDLLARPFAPLPDRLRSAAGRLRALPAALDQAREVLAVGGSRPTSRFHTEKAIERVVGIGDLAQSVVREAEGVDDAGLRAEIDAAVEGAVAAIAAFRTWLEHELLPSANGDHVLGPELYEQKFRHALMSDLTPAQLEAHAEAEYDRVRGEMAERARAIWSDWMGDAPAPDDDATAVRAVLDAIAADHPDDEGRLDFCRAEHGRIEAFVQERDLVGLPDEPMRIVWTPEFLRAFGGAMLIPPGPLDRGLDSYFAITPVPAEWSPERRESYLREDNTRQLRLLTIHEAVPGHYLQLAYANRSPSLVRAIFSSGVFAEGWAVYVTQVMMDVGYGADDPALMLVHLKFYLRSITNALMDIRIHGGRMDEAQAMGLMVGGGFQEEGEALNKWDRARLSSTQLCEYFLGSVEMHGLEAEARRRADADGRAFAYRAHLEAVLAHGTPPTPIIRDILFG
jgi:uncharacterized protein (DUF885 family)